MPQRNEAPVPPVPLVPLAPRRAPGERSPFRPPPAVGRSDDRRVAVASLVVAVAFLAAAVVAVVLPAVTGGSVVPWLPLHLALAGGATSAIAGVMPFFVAALAASPPADARLRRTALALVALGAAGVAARAVLPGIGWLPPLGGGAFLGGIVLTALAMQDAGRRGLMAKRPAVSLGYALALVNVGVGATLATLFVAGWSPIVERWALLRPAHAWTNLVGFVSLVIAATFLHFLPTVLGTRIVARRSAVATVLGLGVGAPVVVVGFAGASDVLVRMGAVLGLVGIAALVAEVVLAVRARGHWTTDAGWHLVATASLLAGAAWFAIGGGIAAGRLVLLGAAPDAWSMPLVGAPLVVGWVLGVLVGAWTHLLPAIGPGGPAGHAARRRILGRFAAPRLAAFDAGVLLLAVGWPSGTAWATTLGAGLTAAALVAGIGLAVRALAAAIPVSGEPARAAPG